MATEDRALLNRALDLARAGDIDGALALLEDAPLDEHVQGFLYMMLRARGRKEQAVTLCTDALKGADTALSRSTWMLRRGLMQLELKGAENAAFADLTGVLRLDASDDHTRQARRALAGATGGSGRLH